jgi:hypothetical protein
MEIQQMATPDGDWQVYCDRQRFEACRMDNRFPYIVALARAVNSLKFVHSAMLHAGIGNSPEARRGRLNSYFFASAILYESLKLVRTMTQAFKQDKMFWDGLHSILRDKAAQTIEKNYLNPVRNKAVFHFLPKFFAEMIRSATCDECIFASGRGKRREELYYPFADVITGGILMGFSSDTAEYYQALGNAMSDTSNLMVRFIDAAEFLIARYMKEWGFKPGEVGPAPDSPENP